MTVLVDDLSKVVNRICRRSRSGEAEPTGRIADSRGCLSGAVIYSRRRGSVANRIQSQINIAEVRICERLVKDVEEPSAELKFLAFSDVEVLKERDIKVTGGRPANVEWRLERTVLTETR